MTRRSNTSSTGSRLRRVAAILLLAASTSTLSGAGASAQTLKLRSLRLPPIDLVGTWVTYHGRSQSRGTPVREFDQRLAVVAKQDLPHGRWGLWVELKTTESRGTTRIERGFFAPASLRGTDLLPGGDGSRLESAGGVRGETPAPAPPSTAGTGSPADSEAFVLLRYQVLTPGGKLYEYPVGTTRYSRASGDVASFELFEYDPLIRPIANTLGPDTLILGRRMVPSVVEESLRYGSDRWPVPGDSTREFHLALTQRFWRNAAVPLTGYARSVFQVEEKAVLIASLTAPDSGAAIPDSLRTDAEPDAHSAGESTGFASTPGDSVGAAGADTLANASDAPADSAMAPEPGPGASVEPPDSGTAVLAWTELTLQDLGADARPEIDQEPELAPDFDEPEIDPTGFQR